MTFAPCIPSAWDECSVTYKVSPNVYYDITIKNPQHVSSGVIQVEVDGQRLAPNEAILLDIESPPAPETETQSPPVPETESTEIQVSLENEAKEDKADEEEILTEEREVRIHKVVVIMGK